MPETPTLLTGNRGARSASADIVMVSMLTPIPHEFALGGVYMPPLLVAAIFGMLAALLTTNLLNRYRLSKYFFYPPVVSLALVILYTLFIGTFIIGT